MKVNVDPKTGAAGSSYFMSYHTASERSAGFIASLRSGRELAANITAIHNMTDKGYKVFAYSVFYVFYEQVKWTDVTETMSSVAGLKNFP